MKITREVMDNRKKYTMSDYEQLKRYYQSKTEQIHIVGEYAKKQLENTMLATQFAEDYFSLPYEQFLNKYFSKRKTDIRQPITAEKFREIFGKLTSEQTAIVQDNVSENILVAAGPGSGKTMVLVHKVASLLLVEDVKPEQFLMLTFSRPAAMEFKTRLRRLVGNIAYQVDIFTYHGFAFQLAGRIGTMEKVENILTDVRESIATGAVPYDRIKNKSVIVVDEYQDVSQEEYDFLMAIVEQADKVRVIAVGDDDQNIYEFRGSSIQFMRSFEENRNAKVYFLTRNYRAKNNLIAFSNLFLYQNFAEARMKHEIPLVPYDQRNGKIEIVNYTSPNLILPLIENLKGKTLQGSTAILTHKNEEAILVTSLLKQSGFPAKLIIDKKGFSIRHLLEITSFTHYLSICREDDFGSITEDSWKICRKKTTEKFKASANLDLFQRVLEHFEKINPRKFFGSWTIFLREIKIEDFYHPEKDAILVSTMHKAKGKEFDNVFILLNKFPLNSEYSTAH